MRVAGGASLALCDRLGLVHVRWARKAVTRSYLSGQRRSVQQKELFKACTRMGWTGDVRALWRALDSDDSGARPGPPTTEASSNDVEWFSRRLRNRSPKRGST